MERSILLCLAIFGALFVGGSADCCNGAICDCCGNMPFGLGKVGCYKSSWDDDGKYKMKVTFFGKTIIDESINVGVLEPPSGCTSYTKAGTGYKACLIYSNWSWNQDQPTGCIKLKITAKIAGIKTSKKDTIACL